MAKGLFIWKWADLVKWVGSPRWDLTFFKKLLQKLYVLIWEVSQPAYVGSHLIFQGSHLDEMKIFRMNTRKWVRPARWDRILFNPVFFQMLIKDTLREKPRQIKIQRLRKVRIWAFGPLAYQINKRFLNWNKIFKKIEQLLAKLRYLRFCFQQCICLHTGFWYGSFVWKWCVFNLSALN